VNAGSREEFKTRLVEHEEAMRNSKTKFKVADQTLGEERA